MKFLWREKVYGWWSVTGLVGKTWFLGFSRRPPCPSSTIPPTTDPRTAAGEVPVEGDERG